MIAIESRDDIAILYMEHGKANVLDVEFCSALATQIDDLASSARAIVLTSRGSIFSAGVDLLRIMDGGDDYVRLFLTVLTDFCETIFKFPNPLVAAINGHAIAGGCVLACMADRRIMVQGTGRIGVPELLVGVPFPSGPLEVMRFSVPSQYFSEIVYGGATHEPVAALERGLVDQVVPPMELLDRSVEWANRLAGVNPTAFRTTKAQVRWPAMERMRQGAEQVDAAVNEAWLSEETKTLIRQYVSRTFKRKKP